MAEQKVWIVKWMPEGDDIDKCRYFRGDNNRAYETLEEAEDRAEEVAHQGQRSVGVFELISVFRPRRNVERVEVEDRSKRRDERRRSR